MENYFHVLKLVCVLFWSEPLFLRVAKRHSGKCKESLKEVKLKEAHLSLVSVPIDHIFVSMFGVHPIWLVYRLNGQVHSYLDIHLCSRTKLTNLSLCYWFYIPELIYRPVVKALTWPIALLDDRMTPSSPLKTVIGSVKSCFGLQLEGQ